MPTIQVNGVTLHYETQGQGPAIVFAHGLFWSGRMFDPQVAALSDRYRCITFDFRGQGQTPATRDGYDMDTLARDAAALIERLSIEPVHFAGLSMGGFIGIRLAARRPELIRSLILLETSADAEPPENVPRYGMLLRAARLVGVGPLAGRVMPIMFGKSFMSDPSRAQERSVWQRRLAANSRSGAIRATKGVIARQSVYDELARLTAPTLIIIGEEDVATTPDHSDRMHAAIAGSRLARIPRAGHTSTIEEPAAVTKAIADFLEHV